MTNSFDTATLGGGCYWCLEAIYQRVNGVASVASGYSGGHLENPTTDQIYVGDTGHAEVIQVAFDPDTVSYRDLLEIFFVMHDPTTLNRQDYDVGELYRSVIFYNDEKQKQTALDVMNKFAADLWNDPIVTQIEPLKKFWAGRPRTTRFL